MFPGEQMELCDGSCSHYAGRELLVPHPWAARGAAECPAAACIGGRSSHVTEARALEALGVPTNVIKEKTQNE